MNTTQEHLAISDIQNDILILKNGGGALILSVSAVNFGLLSDREQMAIITAFAQMLNSLSFSIQIVIMSERLNISSYLEHLDHAQKAQTNPLLSEMIVKYKEFIQKTIKENEVLDKKFYIVVPLFSIELGLTASKSALEEKIKTVLYPRRDQILRQLGRVGLTAYQMRKKELLDLFYNIYNGQLLEEKPITAPVKPQDLAVKLKNPQLPQVPDKTVKTDIPLPQKPTLPMQAPIMTTQSSKAHPFVVEELE